MKIIGYYKDEGFGQFILPTSGALPEHGWKPVVLLEDVRTEIDEALAAMKGMIAEADRDTNPFIAARDFLERIK